MADYGVCIQAASDTSIAWEPKGAHGTLLIERDDKPLQIGLRMGIGKRLGSVWGNYRNGQNKERNIDREVEMDFDMMQNFTEVIEEGEIID